MPESIGKGIASYISALKPAAPEPVNREPVEPISRREPGPTRSVEISISQEAMDRGKSESFLGGHLTKDTDTTSLFKNH